MCDLDLDLYERERDRFRFFLDLERLRFPPLLELEELERLRRDLERDLDFLLDFFFSLFLFEPRELLREVDLSDSDLTRCFPFFFSLPRDRERLGDLD